MRDSADPRARPREPKDSLILSIHIPKTAGTRFSDVLRQRHGKALASYFGAEDPNTHPMLRVLPRDFTADRLNALAESGVKVVHGHIRPRQLMRACPDPAQYWVWLREPIEQTLSHYHFLLGLEPRGGGLREKVGQSNMPLPEFLELPAVQNFQSRFLEPLPLAEAGFVGVTELFSQMIRLLGLADTSGRSNANEDKPLVGEAERRLVAAHVINDLALYSQAMEMALRRIGSRRTLLRHRMRRRLTMLARRFGAPVP